MNNAEQEVSESIDQLGCKIDEMLSRIRSLKQNNDALAKMAHELLSEKRELRAQIKALEEEKSKGFR